MTTAELRVVGLLVLAACAGSACRDAPPKKGPPIDSGLVDAEVVRFFAASSGKQVTVVRGAFIVELTSPRTPGRRFEWGTPTIGSAAIEARGHEVLDSPNPPANADGGSFRHVYRFDAVAAGSARITITPVNGDDLPPPFVLDVTVR